MQTPPNATQNPTSSEVSPQTGVIAQPVTERSATPTRRVSSELLTSSESGMSPRTEFQSLTSRKAAEPQSDRPCRSQQSPNSSIRRIGFGTVLTPWLRGAIMRKQMDAIVVSHCLCVFAALREATDASSQFLIPISLPIPSAERSSTTDVSLQRIRSSEARPRHTATDVVAKSDDASENFVHVQATATASLTRRVSAANIPPENLARNQGISAHSSPGTQSRHGTP